MNIHELWLTEFLEALRGNPVISHDYQVNGGASIMGHWRSPVVTVETCDEYVHVSWTGRGPVRYARVGWEDPQLQEKVTNIVLQRLTHTNP